MPIGGLVRSATFFSPVETDDGYGGTEYGWKEEFCSRMHVHYLRGSESVMQGRLDGKRPAILRIRSSSRTDCICTSWKCNFDGMDFNIRENPKPSDNRLYVEFLVEGGVAVGN